MTSDVTLRYVTLRYVTLRYVTLRYVTLRYVTLRYVTLRYVTLRYDTLRYVTLRYVTLRRQREKCYLHAGHKRGSLRNTNWANVVSERTSYVIVTFDAF